ncbi:MAG: hypothetical protein IIA59_08870 [Candidatus Marinimicrobia bacterium]|nr:hypothetical protein [Candidatus Neomarinimicrobiota bacterium]
MAKFIEGILANSKVDRHGEVLTPDSLREMVEQINTQYVPMTIEHDPRNPPVGRIVGAELVELEDGAVEVNGISEIFELNDVTELKDDSREIPTRATSDDLLHIMSDHSYQGKSAKILIKEISNLFGSEEMEEAKKSLEPLSVLSILGMFTAGAVATGFLSKLGADGYDLFKKKLKNIFSSDLRVATEQLLLFSIALDKEGTVIVIEIIMTNPDSDEIERFMNAGLKDIDTIFMAHVDISSGIRKIVYEYKDGTLILKFGVRKDGVPLELTFIRPTNQSMGNQSA